MMQSWCLLCPQEKHLIKQQVGEVQMATNWKSGTSRLREKVA